MNYKYTIPIFESGDDDEALEAISSLLSERSVLSSEIDDECIDDFSDLTKHIYSNIARSAYGKNIILIANFIQTQKFYHEKTRNHLMKYLFYKGVKFKEIKLDMSKIANDKIIYESITNPDFAPVSRWDPNRIWDEDEFEYSSPYNPINITNPLNIIDHLSLELDRNKAVLKFAEAVNDDTLRFLDCGNKVYLRLLPYASPVHLINIMEAIYKIY